METTNIYTLSDPRTNEVRYVGKANRINERYKAHLNKARKHQIHKWNWIQELKREDLKPVVELIEQVPMTEWRYWERYWINQMKQWGFKLTNHTDGGDGTSNGNQTSFKKGDGGKKVIGYNKEGDKCYEFNTAQEATNFFKTHKSSIPKCASGKSKTIKNIAWFYEENIIGISYLELLDEVKNRFKNERKPNKGSFVKGQKSTRSKKVLMFDMEWNLIREFESAREAGEYIGVTGGAIQFACTKSKENKCKNYKFKYENH